MVIVWRAVEACSLGCAFCGYSRELVRTRQAVDRQAVIAFGRVLSDVQQQMQRSIHVTWLGGEPLSWHDLPLVSRVFHREYGLRLGVTTNGVPLQSEQVLDSLLNDYEQLTISIDGLADFHDRVRGQAGLFERLRASVEMIRREDTADRLWRRVNTVLMRGNIAAFGEFCEAMAEWGFRELTFNQLGGNDRPEFYPANRLLPEQVRRFAAELPALRKRMARRGLAIRGTERYLARIAATAGGQQIGIDNCEPASELLFINTEGRISPCSFSSEAYGVPLAEVRTVDDFRQLPARFREMRLRSRLLACDDCHATHVFDKFKDQPDLAIAQLPGNP